MSYTWTFNFKGAAKVLNEGEESPFVSVLAPNYKAAIKKVLKLQIPNVESEDDLVYSSCTEDYETGESEKLTA